MKPSPTWKFVLDEKYKTENLPIEITSGRYYGVVYCYGSIKPTVLPEGKLNVDIKYYILENPKDKKLRQDFTETVGKILSEMVDMDEEYKAKEIEIEYDALGSEKDADAGIIV